MSFECPTCGAQHGCLAGLNMPLRPLGAPADLLNSAIAARDWLDAYARAAAERNAEEFGRSVARILADDLTKALGEGK